MLVELVELFFEPSFLVPLVELVEPVELVFLVEPVDFVDPVE